MPIVFTPPPPTHTHTDRLTCDRQQLKSLCQVLREAAGCKVAHADAGAPTDVRQELHVHNLAEVAEGYRLGCAHHGASWGVGHGPSSSRQCTCSSILPQQAQVS